jgi:hypothetical protein
MVRQFEGDARRQLDALAEYRDQLARSKAERQILLGLTADVCKPGTA